MKIGSHDELRAVISQAVPSGFLGETYGRVVRSIAEAFDLFNGSAIAPTAGITPFAFATIEEMIPDLIRGRVQTHLEALAEFYAAEGISWRTEELGKSKHKFTVINVRDEFDIIVTKYNNGTKIISSSKKQSNIAQMNGCESLYEEIREIARQRENRPTLFLVYDYKSKMLADIASDEANLDYIHLVLAARDVVSGDMRHYRVDLAQFAKDVPVVLPIVAVMKEDVLALPVVTPKEDALRRAKRRIDDNEIS